MEPVLYIAVLLIGYIAGALSAGLLFRNSRGPGLAASEEEFAGLKTRLAERDRLLAEVRVSLEKAHAEEDRLRAEVKAESERRAMLDAQAQRVPALEQSLAERQAEIAQLRALPRTTPEESRRNAADAVKPLQECLARVDERLSALDRDRGESVRALSEQLQQLARAICPTATPGRWGEVQLRRVVELAGLAEHSDFDACAASGSLVVHLPGNREIRIDSEVPLTSYFEAAGAAGGDDRREKLQAHAAAVRAHVEALSTLAPPQCDFSVAFLPAEPFLAAALEHDPDLLEHGVRNKVLLATPTSLIALLKAVNFGWRQEHLAQNAQEISQLGHVLYERLAELTAHFDEVRGALQHSVQTYNRAVQTLERQVLPGARRFKELGVTSAPDIEPPHSAEVVLMPIEG